MNLSITADVHLSANYPERSKALENILQQTEREGISDLIIAGDLFDTDGDVTSYAHFLNPCRNHPKLKIHLIPGNHDTEKSMRDLNLENLAKYTEPTWVTFDEASFLFVPYLKGMSMGEILKSHWGTTDRSATCIVGHGDFIDGLREPNPREKGIYMPLCKADLTKKSLCRVFLGHIHKPTPIDQPISGKVTYPGSPQGLDITETGERRFLIYDTQTDSLFSKSIHSPFIFFDEKFFVVPSNEEVNYLLNDLRSRAELNNWSQLQERAIARFTVEGFTQNKNELVNCFTTEIKELGIKIYQSPGVSPEPNPNFDRLISATDGQLNTVAQKALLEIEILAESSWDFDDLNSPSLEEVKMAALKTIYQR